MSRVRAVLVAALVAVAIVPIAGAQADKGGHQGSPRQRQEALQRADLLQDGRVPAHRVHPVRHGRDRADGAAQRLHRRRDRGRRRVHRREPRQVRRRDLPVHDRRRPQRHAAGGVRALHPGRRRLRRHPLRVRHGVRLVLVRRARRRVLPRPPRRARRQPAVPAGDDQRRGPQERGDEAPAGPLDARGGVVQLPHQPAGGRPRADVGGRVARTTRAATPCPAARRRWATTRSAGATSTTAAARSTPRSATRASTGRSRCSSSHVLGGIQMAAGAAKFNCPAGA